MLPRIKKREKGYKPPFKAAVLKMNRTENTEKI